MKLRNYGHKMSKTANNVNTWVNIALWDINYLYKLSFFYHTYLNLIDEFVKVFVKVTTFLKKIIRAEIIKRLHTQLKLVLDNVLERLVRHYFK